MFYYILYLDIWDELMLGIKNKIVFFVCVVGLDIDVLMIGGRGCICVIVNSPSFHLWFKCSS